MSGNSIPSLINGSAGKPTVVTVGKKSPCRGCGATLQKGDRCYAVPNPRASFSNPRRFCGMCFKEILERTGQDLTALEKSLQGGNGFESDSE